MLFPSCVAATLLGGVAGQLTYVPLGTVVDQFDAAEPLADEFSHPTLCDSSVKQTSGYIAASKVSKYFFWLFESKSAPKTDPLLMWLSGGPGCSSQLALFAENGPCTVSDDGQTTAPNEFSWHNKANVIWVDQPAGTGFSTGAGSVAEEHGVAKNMYTFLQGFYKSFPEYQKNPFYIFGESYAGHYVPSISHNIWKQNKAGKDFEIPLKGISIGNGLTNPEVQYQYYAEMCHTGGAAEGGHAPGVCGKAKYDAMKAATPGCVAAIAACNLIPHSNGTVGGGPPMGPCLTAMEVCNTAEIIPYQASGMNPYDMRIKCEHGRLCYNFGGIEKFLNRKDVKAEIGTKGRWGSCNTAVAMAFEMAGDWMKGFHHLVPDMLHDGIEVLIYAGDCDFICNWLGNKAWTKALKWDGKDAFNSAEDKEWQFGGETVAKHRNSNHFHFFQVYNAGHMVPMDQPAVSLEMVNKFLSGSLESNDQEAPQLV